MASSKALIFAAVAEAVPQSFLFHFRYKALISLLFCMMQRGQSFDASSEDRELCLKATSLYFILLALPGSGAYTIFHPGKGGC